MHLLHFSIPTSLRYFDITSGFPTGDYDEVKHHSVTEICACIWEVENKCFIIAFGSGGSSYKLTACFVKTFLN